MIQVCTITELLKKFCKVIAPANDVGMIDVGVVVQLGRGRVWQRCLTSQGRPTDIGLQLGKACCPCSR